MKRSRQNKVFQSVLNNLGVKVKSMRLKNGWTQETLAEKASISDKEVSHIEHGKRNITIETLVKIACAFNVEPIYLIGHLPEKPITSDK